MLIEDQDPRNHSITVSVLGAPNVGKSSLINKILGMDLTVVTHLPQTTRNRISCIATFDKTEIVFIDTPGLHSSNKEFNKRLNEQARESTGGADINLLLIDLSKEVLAQFQEFKKTMDKEVGRIWVLFTKADLIADVEKLPLQEICEKVRETMPEVEKYSVLSSKSGEGVEDLIKSLCKEAPNAPHMFMDGDVSNKPERFFVTEYIREQAFLLLKGEVPHEIAVVIDDYRDFRDEEGEFAGKLVSHISATILVNRPSQRAIVVGSQGRMIKEIGTRARKKIEAMVGGQVHLNLHVKVSEKWFNNNYVLEEIGLPRAHDSRRVWRQK